MDQLVDPTNLPMHAVQACDLVVLVGLHELVPVSTVEFFVAFSPIDKDPSKILTSHFNLRVPLVACCAGRGFAFIKGCVRRASHGLIGEGRCFAPAVYVNNLAQIKNEGICPRHRGEEWAQQMMASSLTGHETQRDEKHLRVKSGILFCEWVIFMCPKLIGWPHSE